MLKADGGLSMFGKVKVMLYEAKKPGKKFDQGANQNDVAKPIEILVSAVKENNANLTDKENPINVLGMQIFGSWQMKSILRCASLYR